MAAEPQVRQATERELRRVKPALKLLSWAQTALFRASGGRLGRTFRGAPVGLLTTTGRRSGQPRTLPLIYLRDRERIVLVASQGGAVRDPVWYLNLVATPEVLFQTGDEPLRYRARRCTPEEKAAYWPGLCAIYADYESYQRRSPRDIPVVALEPLQGA